MKKIETILEELTRIVKNIYKPAGLKITSAVQAEAESSEYGACRFGLNGFNIVFRIAKITPKKLGQFVTLWKRSIPNSPIIPLDTNDDIDFVIINVADGAHQGQFVFSQKVLMRQCILSHHGQSGKLAFRVYPSWVRLKTKTAIKTQQWQLQHFFLTSQKETTTRLHNLLHQNTG